ncbi:MAG: lipopolysaccharide kinase InaA family protein, partial [Tannerella sp.]|nr:lipopolysaccharide kinase InaA family protein [Tannerella sp.]
MRRTKTVVSDTYKNPEILQFTEHLHECFETGQVLHNERNVIKSCQLKDANGTINEIIVKRYKRPGWLQRIVYGFFRSSKAKRAFRNAHELRERGIDTPHEIAFTEQKCGGLLEYCYYVSESNRNRPIRDELIRPENFNRSMAAAFAAFAAELHEKGILHHDLNSTNVLYHLNDTHYNFSVIDINRMR